MSDEEKKPYVEMASKDKERAESEKAAYAVRDSSPLRRSVCTTNATRRTRHKECSEERALKTLMGRSKTRFVFWPMLSLLF